MACRQARLFQMGTSTSRRAGLEVPKKAVVPQPFENKFEVEFGSTLDCQSGYHVRFSLPATKAV